MPAVQPKQASGTPIIPPAIQSQVIALRAAGKSKRSIAEELGIHRNTVSNVIEHMQADIPDYSSVVHKLAGRALTRIDQVIDSDTDTAKWTLEHTLFRPDVPEAYHVHGDVSLTQAAMMLPSTPSQPSTPSTTVATDGTGPAVSTGTEAAKMVGYDYLDLSNHPNFFREISKQPPKQPITLSCNGETLQIMRLPSSRESAEAEGVIEVSPLPPSSEQGDAEGEVGRGIQADVPEVQGSTSK